MNPKNKNKSNKTVDINNLTKEDKIVIKSIHFIIISTIFIILFKTDFQTLLQYLKIPFLKIYNIKNQILFYLIGITTSYIFTITQYYIFSKWEQIIYKK